MKILHERVGLYNIVAKSPRKIPQEWPIIPRPIKWHVVKTNPSHQTKRNMHLPAAQSLPKEAAPILVLARSYGNSSKALMKFNGLLGREVAVSHLRCRAEYVFLRHRHGRAANSVPYPQCRRFSGKWDP